jgi:hypothetical protein
MRYSKYNSFNSLFKHMKSCSKIPLTCGICRGTFQTVDELKDHLRRLCKFVTITCSECNKDFVKSKFFSHECPKKYSAYTAVILEQDAEIGKLQAEKAGLEAQLGDVKSLKAGTESELKTNMGQKSFVKNLIAKQVKERETIYS